MDDLRRRALASPPAPAVERPGAGTENRQRQEAAGHREVLPEVDRLIRAEVKKEQGQETESENSRRSWSRMWSATAGSLALMNRMLSVYTCMAPIGVLPDPELTCALP